MARRAALIAKVRHVRSDHSVELHREMRSESIDMVLTVQMLQERLPLGSRRVPMWTEDGKVAFTAPTIWGDCIVVDRDGGIDLLHDEPKLRTTYEETAA